LGACLTSSSEQAEHGYGWYGYLTHVLPLAGQSRVTDQRFDQTSFITSLI
jgi:hypothetical protein